MSVTLYDLARAISLIINCAIMYKVFLCDSHANCLNNNTLSSTLVVSTAHVWYKYGNYYRIGIPRSCQKYAPTRTEWGIFILVHVHPCSSMVLQVNTGDAFLSVHRSNSTTSVLVFVSWMTSFSATRTYEPY